MQQIIVIVLVVAAVLYSAWKLMPARRRLRVLLRLDAWLARRNLLQAWRKGALARRVQSAAGAGCSGCAANVGLHRQQPR
jgi:hypothetical protein